MQVSAAYRRAAIGDLDNDGRLDMVVTVLNGKAKILRNVSTNTNNWVAFKLVGRRSNRMAIGAQLKLTTDDGSSQYDIVSTSAGYGASRAHFGLGQFKTVKQLEIRWPGGARQALKDLPANRIHRVEEP
jgi:enediyne biosynthesis protein E4